MEGELILFVAPFGDPKAVPIPFPDDCPPRPVSEPNLAPMPTPAG